MHIDQLAGIKIFGIMNTPCRNIPGITRLKDDGLTVGHEPSFRAGKKLD